MIFTLMKVGIDNNNFVMTGTKDEIMKFVYAQAEKLNYGFYRVWYNEPFTYFDCGPISYKVNADWSISLLNENSDELEVEN